jgi:hypothetical protein
MILTRSQLLDWYTALRLEPVPTLPNRHTDVIVDRPYNLGTFRVHFLSRDRFQVAGMHVTPSAD